MMGKLYAALRSANAPEVEAREAEEEAAAVHGRPDGIERGLDGVRAEIVLLRSEIVGLRTEFKGEIRRLEWALLALLGVAASVAGKYFLHG